MNKPLSAMLTSKSKPWQYLLTMTGAFLGMVIIMCGLQVYQMVGKMMEEKDLLGGEYIVISKKVGLLNTISGSAPSFSDGEIHEIEKIDGIDGVARFTSGNFKASLRLEGQMAEFAGPGLSTEIFFESVPENFVDAEPGTWTWTEGSPTVPIIIPSDYISLYNTAFAQSQGLPVIPESLIRSIELEIRVRGNGREETFSGRIAGFSQRINSILVPQTFLNYGNAKFGNPGPQKPSRLVLHSNNPASPKLAAELTAKGYELNEEKLKSSKLNHILQTMITVVSGIGIVIVLLALLGFVQYNQLMAYRSSYEIQTLHWIGFPVRKLVMPYVTFTFNSIGVAWILAVAAFWFLRYFFNGWLRSKGFEIQLPHISWSVISGFVISLLMAIAGSWAAMRQVKALSK